MDSRRLVSRLSPLALAIALAACGGGGGGGGSSTPTPPPAGKTTPISGSVVKGLVLAAKVEIFEVAANGNLNALITAETDGQGRFGATLPVSYQGGPLKLVAGAGTTSQMVCDAPAGCGNGSQFGDKVALDAAFKLSATHPGTTPGQTVAAHVNPFTSLATALGEKRGLNAETIRSCNSQVQALFALAGDPTQQAAFDVTQPAAASQASEAALKAQLLAAGLMGALQSNGQGQTWNARLTDLASRYANQNGQLVVNDPEGGNEAALVSVEDILEQARAAALSLRGKAEAAHQDVPGLKVADALLQLDMQAAQRQTEGQLSQTQPLPTANANRLAKAKALVNDVRTVALSSNLDKLETGAERFRDQVKLAAAASNADTERALTALQHAGEAMAAAAEAYADSPNLRSFSLRIANGDTLVVGISPVAGGLPGQATYTLRQSVQGTALDVTGTAGLSETESGTVTKTRALLDLAGSASNTGVTLGLTKVKLELDGEYEDQGMAGGRLTYKSHNFDLQLSLTQQRSTRVSDPVSFSGQLKWTLQGYEHRFVYSSGSLPNGAWQDAQETTDSLDKGALHLKGRFANSQHNLEAFLDVDLDGIGENGAVHVGERFTWTWLDGRYTEDSESIEESESNYLAFDASLGFIANLPGVDGTSKVLLGAKRTGYQAGSVELNVQFLGKQLTLSTAKPQSSPQYTLRNQDGAELRLNKDERKTLSGTVVVEGEQQGTVEQAGSIVLVRYKDGSFESLN